MRFEAVGLLAGAVGLLAEAVDVVERCRVARAAIVVPAQLGWLLAVEVLVLVPAKLAAAVVPDELAAVVAAALLGAAAELAFAAAEGR